jgi:5-methylcytosine-specific restriction endonuclease McrA
MTSVWSDRSYLLQVAEESSSISEMIERAGMSKSGAAYRMLTKWAEIHEVALPKYGRYVAGQPVSVGSPVSFENWLEDQRLRSPKRLLYHLVRAGIKELSCEECGQGTVWNGKPLTLHLDHIDGDHGNNLLENLRILCPHCHTQTPTYGAKNRDHDGHSTMEDNFCGCGNLKQPYSPLCGECSRSESKRGRMESPESRKTIDERKKPGPPPGSRPSATRAAGVDNNGWKARIVWPAPEYLVRELSTRSYRSLENELGVSAAAIKKYLKRNGMEPPKKHKKSSPRDNRNPLSMVKTSYPDH